MPRPKSPFKRRPGAQRLPRLAEEVQIDGVDDDPGPRRALAEDRQRQRRRLPVPEQGEVEVALVDEVGELVVAGVGRARRADGAGRSGAPPPPPGRRRRSPTSPPRAATGCRSRRVASRCRGRSRGRASARRGRGASSPRLRDVVARQQRPPRGPVEPQGAVRTALQRRLPARGAGPLRGLRADRPAPPTRPAGSAPRGRFSRPPRRSRSAPRSPRVSGTRPGRRARSPVAAGTGRANSCQGAAVSAVPAPIPATVPSPNTIAPAAASEPSAATQLRGRRRDRVAAVQRHPEGVEAARQRHHAGLGDDRDLGVAVGGRGQRPLDRPHDRPPLAGQRRREALEPGVRRRRRRPGPRTRRARASLRRRRRRPRPAGRRAPGERRSWRPTRSDAPRRPARGRRSRRRRSSRRRRAAGRPPTRAA